MNLAPNGKPSNLTPEQYKLVRTPAFKKWFGDWENEKKNKNMALDLNEEPLVFWHSGGDFYKMRKEQDTDGLMFSLGKESRAYSKDGKQIITRPYFIKSDKIYSVKYEHRNSPLIYQNKKHKFPLYMVNAYGGFVIVHEPTQIKLADGTNTTFNANNNDVRYGKGANINKKKMTKIKKTNDGKDGGLVGGKKHSEGGVKTIIVDDGRPVEIESGEVIITAPAVKKHWKELDRINQDGGGVPIHAPEMKKGGNAVTSTPMICNRNISKTGLPNTYKEGANVYGSKISKVMQEFKDGKLRSSSGDKVTSQKQALAIAFSEERKMRQGGNL